MTGSLRQSVKEPLLSCGESGGSLTDCTGEEAKLPLRYSLNLSGHFYVWVTVWVRRLTHILTHT